MILDEEEGRRRLPDRVIAKRMLRYVAACRLKVLLLILLVALGTITTLTPPYLLKIAIDDYILKGDLMGLGFIALLYIALHGITSLLLYGQTYLTSWIGRRIEYDLKVDLFRHLQELSLSYFDRRESGRIISRITNDVDHITDFMTSGAISVLIDASILVGILGVMINMSLSLSLATFTILPPMILFTILFGRRARAAYRETRSTISTLTSRLEESILGIRIMQAFRREEEGIHSFDKANLRNFNANIRAGRIEGLFFPAMQLFGTLGTCLVLWYGGFAVLEGTLTIGVLVAFMAYLNRFFMPIQDLGIFYHNIQSAMASAERIFELLDSEVEVKEAEDAVDLPRLKGKIRFEHVTFGYDPANPVLKEIDLEIKAKETVALVGLTGAGKTSIANLICRFYDPQEGRVLVDDCDLRRVRLKTYRNQLGIVPQDPFLFAGTIAENIRYGRPDAGDDEVIWAATLVGIHEFITSLPEGYQTDVRERGGKLSLGQRRLVSLARALLADPRILILDEATSSVDPYSEMLFQRALRRLLEDRTAIIIAHRLNTVKDADRIVVVDQGRIVEIGAHEELIRRRGVYFRLYTAQFKTQRLLPRSPEGSLNDTQQVRFREGSLE